MNLMSEEDLKQIRAYFELAKSLAPLADEALEVVFTYGPVLRKLMDSIHDYQVDRTLFDIKKYELYGMSREEAIMLTINNKISLQELLSGWNSVNTTKKEKK